jgi:hypothetical protein
VLFLSSWTILHADLDLKIGRKLKIVNDIITSIIGKQGKMKLAHMNSSLHGSCKFNKEESSAITLLNVIQLLLIHTISNMISYLRKGAFDHRDLLET